MGKIKMLFKNVYVLIFMFVFASTFIFLIILNKKAMPAIMNYASVQTKRVGIEVLRSTGTKEVNKLLNDSNLFITNKNESGEIETIDFNTGVINEALIIVSKNVRKRLKEVEGIGSKKIDQIVKSFEENRVLRNIIIELSPYGITPNYCMRIYKKYKNKAIKIINETP